MHIAPPPVPLSIVDGLRSAAQRYPRKIAVEDRRRSLRYCELLGRVESLCGLILRYGPPGRHIAIVAGNCVEFCEVVFAAARSGTPLVTPSPRLSDQEINRILEHSDSSLVFCDQENHARIADLGLAKEIPVIAFGGDYEATVRARSTVRADPIDDLSTFTIPYTSGTTGQPKGVLVSHRSRVLTLFAMGAEYECFYARDRFLAIAPMCHGAGLVFALAPLFFGAYVRLEAAFDPERTLRLVNELSVTGLFAVPTHLFAMFELERLEQLRPNTLQALISNAAALPEELKERTLDFFGDALLHETYGSTEAGIVSNLRPEDQRRKSRCVGHPIVATEVSIRTPDNTEAAVGEVGELFSRSPYNFNGYWHNENETRNAFDGSWVSVADMARRDEEGYLYIVDRKKDMIVSGGINVYPREVEQVIETHPAVAEAAVVGIPDRKWGESIVAYLVAKPGQSPPDRDALAAYCETRLSRLKHPRLVERIDTLPRNASGKILKAALRQRASNPDKRRN